MRTQYRKPESQGRGDGEIKTTSDKLIKKFIILDEKHEKLAKTVAEEVVKSQ